MAIDLNLKRKNSMQKISYKYLMIGILGVVSLVLSSCEQENLNDLSDTLFIRHQGADMPAHIYGNGSEKVFLILLHGGPGGDGLTYRFGPLENIVEKSYAVVYYDQRGSGQSQGRYDKDDLTIDLMVDDVKALVDVIKHKYGNDSRFFLMGHSWGGTLGVATLLKSKQDDHFKGWINLDGGHDWNKMYFRYIDNFTKIAPEQISQGNNVNFWQEVLTTVDEVDKNTANVDDMQKLNIKAHRAERKLYDDGFIQINEDGNLNALFRNNILTTIWQGSSTSRTLLRDEIVDDWSFEERLNEITIPSLVLWGKYDMVVPLSMGEKAFEKLGSDSKRLVVFDSGGHFPAVSEPEKFADEIIDFINLNK